MCNTTIPYRCEHCGSCNVFVFEGFYYTTIECRVCGHKEDYDKFDDDDPAYDTDALEDLFGWERDIK